MYAVLSSRVFNCFQGNGPEKRPGFTLIELLIVVAIIAILAAIAVPNFLEAQMRAKVSRVENDLRSIATGMEAYYMDWNDYPETSDESLFIPTGAGGRGLLRLTTPIAYLSAVPMDPFLREASGQSMAGPLTYDLLSSGGGKKPGTQPKGWAALSSGPDQTDDTGPSNPNYPTVPMYTTVYDPTNGTRSTGDILRFGPRIFYEKITFR